MADPSFGAFLGAVNAEAFSANKLAVIEQATTSNFFLVAQVDRLIRSLSFSADKLRALELTAPRIVDRGNAFALFEGFTFTADKQRAREILKRNGY
jgi:Domain of unknown function (DUF4476)